MPYEIFVGYTVADAEAGTPGAAAVGSPFAKNVRSAFLIANHYTAMCASGLSQDTTSQLPSAIVRDWLVSERRAALATAVSAWESLGRQAYDMPPLHHPVFVGFDVDAFLDTLAANCAVAGGFGRLPYSVNNVGRVELRGWLPEDPSTVFACVAPTVRDDVFLNRVKDWPGPGKNPSQDAYVAMHLAMFLGLAGHKS